MKNVLVIGASRGIGLALVKEYLKEDAQIYALCREASEQLKDIQGIHIIEGAEVSQIDKLETISTELGSLIFDEYIHVAGIYQKDGFPNSHNWDDFTKSFEVNSIAPLKTLAIFRKHLSQGSKIGLLSSRMGSISDNTSGGSYSYRMSKAALNCAAKALSIDLKDQGVAVASIHPGFVQTDMTNGGGNLTPAQSAAGLRQVMNNLTLENSGSFFHSNQETLPW